jgi:hypothetical protein
MSIEAGDWVPGQDVPKQGPDFRFLETSVRGYKIGPSSTANTTKTQPAVRRLVEAALKDDEESLDVQMDDEAAPQVLNDAAARNVVGVGARSCRPWKLAATGRSTSSIRKVSKSWDQKVRIGVYVLPGGWIVS